jgi:trigger factor
MTGGAPYTFRTMQVTSTPGPAATVVLEIELPPDRLGRAIDDAVRRLSRQTRVAGFRPGKAPRPVLERHLGPGVVLDEAVEHLVQDAYREALTEQAIVPLTNAEVEIVQAEEGKPLVFKATVQVPPEIQLGDYKHFNFAPEIETIDDARVDKVLEELRDQNATLTAVEGRGAQDGDYAVISFEGSRDGEPFEGGSSERMPLILGQERLIPGFEANLVGLEVGGSTEFDITFPDDYPETELAG